MALRPRLFSMVHLGASAPYTELALKSFFECTALSSADKFILIDNDRSFKGDIQTSSTSVQRNESPRGFAENMNQALLWANEANADLYFLNNDLIFTPHWDVPLRAKTPSILSPLSNREVQYEATARVKKSGHVRDSFETRLTMSMEEYLAKKEAFDFIAAAHRAKSEGVLQVYVLPFFCVKIPIEIYSKLGRVDESFGKGGAEDYDYCLRAYLGGFTVKYTLGSYILHFGGRSTHAGVESEKDQLAREHKFKTRFEEKWGEVVYRTILLEDTSAISQTPKLNEADMRQDLAFVIRSLMPHKVVAVTI